jgi:hypothetical protein
MRSADTQFEFVISDPVSNLKPGKSLQIRSRCMHGKNKREGSRRTEREKRKLAKEMSKIIESRSEIIVPTIPSPRPLINDVVPIRFAGCGINTEAQALLFKAFVRNFVDRNVTPLDRCVDLDCLESESFSWLFDDAAYLHSVLCASYAINDFRSPHWNGIPSRKTLFHLQQTLALLRIKLQNEHVHQDETVLRVIINLALLAAVFGDWVAAAAHFQGLLKIVCLRGNMAFLKSRPTLHFKLDRMDLAWCLSAGRKPYFVQPIKSWDCTIAIPYAPLPSNLYRPPAHWDYRVVNVFKDFQKLALKINRNRLRFVFHNPSIFQNDLASVQSRLISLADSVTKPIERLVRLVMLAMLTTTYRIPGRRISYGWLVEQLKEVFITASSEIRSDKSLLLWTLVMASSTVAKARDEWIRDAWMTVGAEMEWVDVKAHLLKVMWIEIVHDEPGEAAYEELRFLTSAH